MRIAKLKIKNFLSFDNFEIDFDKNLNIIVGPNNSGKTNIIRTLNFAKEILRSHMWDSDFSFFCHNKEKNSFSIEIICDFEAEEEHIKNFVVSLCSRRNVNDIKNSFYSKQWDGISPELAERWRMPEPKNPLDYEAKKVAKDILRKQKEDRINKQRYEESQRISDWLYSNFLDIQKQFMSHLASCVAKKTTVKIEFIPPNRPEYYFASQSNGKEMIIRDDRVSRSTERNYQGIHTFDEWFLMFLFNASTEGVFDKDKADNILTAILEGKGADILSGIKIEELLDYILSIGGVQQLNLESEGLNLLSNEMQFKIINMLKEYYTAPLRDRESIPLGYFLARMFFNRFGVLTETRERPLTKIRDESWLDNVGLSKFLNEISSGMEKGLGIYLYQMKNHSDDNERNRFKQIQKDFTRITEFELDVSYKTNKIETVVTGEEKEEKIADIQIWITKGDKSVPVEFTGAGTLEILTILYVLSGKGGHCVLLDEPAAHLHPSFQEGIIKTIKTNGGNNQIIIITHSSHLITTETLKNCQRFYIEENNTISYNINTAISKVSNRQIIEDPHFKRSLFSRGVILFEGQSEFFAIPTLLSKMGVNLEDHNIEIINLQSHSNFNNYISLYDNLKIKWIAIGDKKAKSVINKAFFEDNKDRIHLFPSDDFSTFLRDAFKQSIHPSRGKLANCLDIVDKTNRTEIESVKEITELITKIRKNFDT